MRTEDIKWLREHNAVFSQNGRRFEIPLENDGKTVGYFPIKGIMIFAYYIKGGAVPDMMKFEPRAKTGGKFVRTISCRSGKCELKRNSKSVLLWTNELAVDYGENYEPIEIIAEEYTGLETVLFTDEIASDGSIFGMLREYVINNELHNLFKKTDFMYCMGMSSPTKRELDAVLQLCATDTDAVHVLINIAELGYLYSGDRDTAKSVRREFISKSQLMIAEDIYNTLTEHCDQKWTASYFAEKYGFSTTTVKKYFESVYGYEFKEYQIKVRMDKAAELLTTTSLPVGEIAQLAGYSTHAKFGAMFREKFGVTPLEYRRAYKIRNAK